MNKGYRVAVSRLLSAAIVALGVTTLVFLLIHCVPGDPVDVMLGEYARASDRAALEAALGLDKPLLVQWLDYLGAVLRLDFGRSLTGGQAIGPLVAQHFLMTLLLALAALAVSLGVGLPLGVLAAVRADGPWEVLSSSIAVLGMSVPNFVLGPLLILPFAVWLEWLPVGGASDATAIVLPALTLGFSLAAMLARMTRAAVRDVLAEPYVLAAHARGLTRQRVLRAHVARNAALPVATVLGLQLGALLGGAVVTEVVFAWPGIGQLMIESILNRDYPVVQACVLLIALCYVMINTLTDLAYTLLDPRVEVS